MEQMRWSRRHNGACFTALPAALQAPWNLPRAKNVPPARFCTSVRTGAALSIPTQSIYEKIPHLVVRDFFMVTRTGIDLHFRFAEIKEPLGRALAGKSPPDCCI